MFLRHKRIGKYTYVYLVESVYQDGRTRQHIIRNLGRREDVEAGGDLERLAASAARLSRKALVLSAEARGAAPVLGCRRVGPGLVFERLWTETGCRAVIEELARDRKFGFAIERAVFLTVVHRLMVSGADRAADKWRQDYAIEGADDLRLHQRWTWCSWTPPRCSSKAPAARRWAGAATARTTGPTSTRWCCPSSSTARGGRSAPRPGRGIPPTSRR
jgi:hypothetical protein